MKDRFKELERYIHQERIHTSPEYLTAFSSDAGFYKLQPAAVIIPETFYEIQIILEFCARNQLPAAFRSGASSFSSASLTSGVLILVPDNFSRIKITGNQVFTGSAVTIGKLNFELQKKGRMIRRFKNLPPQGTVGGAIAAASSGLYENPLKDSHFKIKAMHYILPGGAAVNTEEEDADSILYLQSPAIYRSILDLWQRIISSPDLKEKIFALEKFSKSGYALSAFLKSRSPAEIIKHLLAGSSGTLGFIGEVVLETEKIPEFEINGIWIMSGMAELKDAADYLLLLGADSLQYLDESALKLFPQYSHLPANSHALRFCFMADTVQKETYLKNALIAKMAAFHLHGLSGIIDGKGSDISFSEIYSRFLPHAPVVVMHPAVPRTALPELVSKVKMAVADLPAICVTASPATGAVTLLAKLPTHSENEMSILENKLGEICRGLGGRSSAGMGHSRAATVISESDPEIIGIWNGIKQILDPSGILGSPGDWQWKPSSVTGCTECGLCSNVCPSANLTLTPAGRIRLMNEILRNGREQMDGKTLEYLLSSTCANDGLCGVSCPVKIDTGRLIHQNGMIQEMLAENRKQLKTGIFRKYETLKEKMAGFTSRESFMKKFSGMRGKESKSDFVYTGNCLTAVTAGAGKTRSVEELFFTLCERADFPVNGFVNSGYCCGKYMENEGELKQHKRSLNDAVALLYKHGTANTYIIETDQCGRTILEAYPLLTDENKLRFRKLKLISSLDFIQNHLLEQLSFKDPAAGNKWFQTNCSVPVLGKKGVLENILAGSGNEMKSADCGSCCGMGGGRGVDFPEMLKAGKETCGDEFISVSGICSHAFGSEGRHLYHLLLDSLKGTSNYSLRRQ